WRRRCRTRVASGVPPSAHTWGSSFLCSLRYSEASAIDGHGAKWRTLPIGLDNVTETSLANQVRQISAHVVPRGLEPVEHPNDEKHSAHGDIVWGRPVG